MPRLNDVRRFSKSVIEEWKNSTKLDENVLRNDQLYEERAIDVGPDACRQSCPKGKADRDKMQNGEKNVAKSKSRNIGGTVRSIPIKTYQASIAHNIGTLRRSEAPQQQFESSMSEPEKCLCPTNYEAASSPRSKIATQFRRSGRASTQARTLDPSRRSCHSCDFAHEIQNGRRKVGSKLKTLDRRIARSEHNILLREDDQDFSDFDGYFHKSASQKFGSRRRQSRIMKAKEQSKQRTSETVGSKRSNDEESRVLRRWGTVDLEHGHVGQKISAYEENAKRGVRNADSIDQYQIFPEVKKHRAIGVPLVGMHNACGLPVVASWHDHELLETLRVRGRVLGTLRPIFKGPRASLDVRRRNNPKRKTLPSQGASRRRQPSDFGEAEEKIEYPSVKSLVSLEAGDFEIRKKVRRHRPSFKAKKTGTFSSRGSVKRNGKSIGRKNKENCIADSLRRKSLENGSSKRQTLYARDNGDDAVQVLKGLCLNPLARTKSETDMIW